MAKSAKKKSAPKTPSTGFSSRPTTSDIPRPWINAPSNLDPFLANLETDHFYITSIDRHDKNFKRRLFMVPLLLNIFLTVVVIYRIYIAVPTYLDILVQLLGYETAQKVDIRELSRSTAFNLWLRRALMFLGDFFLLRFVAMWPIDFFLGRGALSGEAEAGPVSWRRAVNFRDQEIVVRRSRKWDRSIFYKDNMMGTGTINAIEDMLGEGVESGLFQERIRPATSRRFIREKTGYQMLDRSWELYFSGMIEAHALVDAESNEIQDFQTSVLVFVERWGWLVWDVWRDQEQGEFNEGSKRLQNIKDSLTAMGKENLFFRMIEVIQSETSQTGSFTSEKRDKAIEKMREDFEEQKVDFDAFWSHAGGISSMPGLETT